MSIFTNKNILLETYFGVPKEFNIVESELKKIIEIIKKDIKNSSLFKARTDLDFSDSNILIQKVLSKYFGVDYIKIHWTDSGPNAYTRMTSMPVMFMENLKKKKENGRFVNENLKIYVFIDTGLVKYADLNEKELLAVLLHEIGHNFDISPFHFFIMLGVLFFSPLAWAISGFIGLLINEITMALDNFFKKYLPIIYNASAAVNSFFYHLSGPLTRFNPVSILLRLGKNPYIIVRSILGYGQERFADSFAAAYGYGEFQASALNKMQTTDKQLYNAVVNNTPILNMVSDFTDILCTALDSFLDPHPATQTRMKNMINKLKRDLEDPTISKDLKKDLEDNIKAFEDYYQNYLNDPTAKKQKVFSSWMRKLNEDIFKGKMDYREFLNSTYEQNEA